MKNFLLKNTNVKNIIFLSVILFSKVSFAACYVDADLKCQAVTSNWAAKGPIIRKLLFNTKDVQENQKNCILFATLIKNECQIADPVQAVYTLGVSSYPTYITTFESGLPQLTDLPESFRDYFNGLLVPPPIPLQEISAAEVEKKSPGTVPPPIVLKFNYSGNGSFPISSEPALAVGMMVGADGKSRFFARPMWGNYTFNPPSNPAPNVSTNLIELNFINQPALLDLTLNLDTSVTCGSKGPFKFKINPKNILVTSTNAATWPRLSMTRCGGSTANSNNLGTGNYRYTVLTDQSTSPFPTFSLQLLNFNTAETTVVNTGKTFWVNSGFYLREELPLTLNLYRREGLAEAVIVQTKTVTTATPAPGLSLTVEKTMATPFPNAYSLSQFPLNHTPNTVGDFHYYMTLTTNLGTVYKSSEILSKVVSTAPLNGVCKTTNEVLPAPAGCLSGNNIGGASSAAKWNWTCQGLNGGSSATCSAPRPAAVNASCVNYNSAYAVQPAKDDASACLSGTYKDAADSGGYYYWNCLGSNGGATLGCRAQSSVPANDGRCKIFSAAYSVQPAVSTEGGCDQGIYVDVADDSLAVWKWRCDGVNGGRSSEICTAQSTTRVNGECRYSGGNSSVATYTQSAIDKASGCIAGEYVDKPDSGTNTWTWTCNGNNGGTSAQCSNPKSVISKGTCAGFSTAQSTEPIVGTPKGCAVGSYIDVADTPTQWKWQCRGFYDGPLSPICVANKTTGFMNGSCGAAQGVQVDAYPYNYERSFCTVGTHVPTDQTAIDGSYKWNCVGLNGGSTAACSAPTKAICGTADRTSVDSYPQSGLCKQGNATATDTLAADGNFNWTCTKPASVTNTAQCLAYKLPPRPQPVLLVATPDFDPAFYIRLYPNLFAAGTTYSTAQTQWINLGVEQGLRGSQVFDAKEYLFYNPDLAAIFGTNNYRAAYNHFMSYGQFEGRRSSLEFDPKYYLDNYPDLKQAFGTNYQLAYSHWQTTGLKEGRKGSSDFDIQFYLNNYPDVAAYVGGAGNYEAGYFHWLQYGKFEGRQGVLDINTIMNVINSLLLNDE